MFSQEQIEKSFQQVLDLYLKGKPHDADKLRDKKLEQIHGPRIIRGKWDPGEYEQRIAQEALFPLTIATHLRSLENSQFYPSIIGNTAKALKLGLNVLYPGRMSELEAQGSMLYVPRVELDPDSHRRDTEFTYINNIMSEPEKYEAKIEEVKTKVDQILEPAKGLPVGVTGFSLIIPYADQLVKVVDEDGYSAAYGKLIGVEGCVSNVGIESTRYLNRSLRTYSDRAYREWNLCLKVNPTEGKIDEDIKAPVGIKRNLAGLTELYVPLTYFQEKNMFYNESRKKR